MSNIINKPPVMFSPVCCSYHNVLPENGIECFYPDLMAEYKKIIHRYCQLMPRRQRLLHLAKPKCVVPKSDERCACRFPRPVQIVYLEQRKHTRTEHLALPPVRKLIFFKTQVQDLFDPFRLSILNRTLRTSLFTLYSHLSNAQPPEKPQPSLKLDKKQMKARNKYLKNLAKARTPPEPPKLPVKAMPYKQMKRYKKLAKPKERLELIREAWVLLPGVKAYEPTDRILNLAKPKTRDEDALYVELPWPISDEAKKYKATSRIKELAIARVRAESAGDADIKEDPFSIPPNALKAKARPRIIELAEPKEYENVHTRDNPNAISPAALKAKASPRILELAKPRAR